MRTSIRTTRLIKFIALALAATASGVAAAPAAPECSMSATLADWGENSTGDIDIAAGQSCQIPIGIRGTVTTSAIAQKPAGGKLKKINASTFEYKAKAKYKGSDTLCHQGDGSGGRKRPAPRSSPCARPSSNPVRAVTARRSRARPGRRRDRFVRGALRPSARRWNDRSDMLAAQRRGEPAGHQSVHELHARKMSGIRHHLEQRDRTAVCPCAWPARRRWFRARAAPACRRGRSDRRSTRRRHPPRSSGRPRRAHRRAGTRRCRRGAAGCARPGTRDGDRAETPLPTTARDAERWIASWLAMVGCSI